MRRGLPTQELPSRPLTALRESYGGVEAPPKKAPQEDEEYYTRRFLANAFSLVLSCAFGPPIIVSIKIAIDEDVAFWIGEWGYFGLLVWILIIGQHILHLWMLRDSGRAQRSIFFVVPITCSIIIMIIGCIYYSAGKYVHGQLKSKDCAESTMYNKYWLQQAYDQAHLIYDHCQNRVRAENNDVPLLRQPPLQNCEEWRDFLDMRRGEKLEEWAENKVPNRRKWLGGLKRFSSESFAYEWEYLAWAEAEHLCGGFCERGPSLFVSYDRTGRDGGPCARRIAMKFITVYDNGFKVFSIGCIIFALTVPTYLLAIPQLTALGYTHNKAAHAVVDRLNNVF